MNSLNYSFTMNGIQSCSHGCIYCSAARTLDYAQGVSLSDIEGSLKKIDEKTYGEFRADFDKMAETLERNSRFITAKQLQQKGQQAHVHIDIWGGDPVTNHLATQEIVDFAEDFFVNKHGMALQLSSSTGGFPLMRDDICDYYREHNITLQLSHDGCGQWMRTGNIDPLYDEPFAHNIADLFREGRLNMVNDCLNFYNGDTFANKKFWDNYFRAISLPKAAWNKLFIKLNRCYDGVYDIKKKNVRGIFGSDKREWDELKGKPFGDIRHHNSKLSTGNVHLDHLLHHELDNYIADWYKLAIMMRDPRVVNDPWWKPYKSYITEQVNRWKPMPSRYASLSACRSFQMTKHQVGDPKYWKKPNSYGEIEMFVIDTIGKYCECNLIDSDHTVMNIGCSYTPEVCKYCPYYLQAECQGCGSEIFTDDCQFRYQWIRMLENVKFLDELLRGRECHK